MITINGDCFEMLESWILVMLYCSRLFMCFTDRFIACRHTYIYMYIRVSISIHFLTHWGRVTHICVGELTIIGSDNGLSPGRRQAIIWTNAGILLIEPLGTNFSEILIGIQIISFKKMRLKMSSAKWRPFCLGLNVLMHVFRSNTKVSVSYVISPAFVTSAEIV